MVRACAADEGGSDGILINLLSGEGHGGPAEGDQFVSIEDVHGSRGDDILIGDEGENDLDGRIGNDILIGNGGDDTILGFDGDDLLILSSGFDYAYGGEGDDIIVLRAGSAVAGSDETIIAKGNDLVILDADAATQGEASFTANISGDTLTKIDMSDFRDEGGDTLTFQDILDHQSAPNQVDLNGFFSESGVALEGTIRTNPWISLTADNFIFEGGMDWEALLPSGVEPL